MINAKQLKEISDSKREEKIQEAFEDRFSLVFLEKKLMEKACLGDPRYTLYSSNLRQPIAIGLAEKIKIELLPILEELGFYYKLKLDFNNPYYSHITLHISWDSYTAKDFESEED